MILLHAYLYIYSLLRGVTFKILLFDSYALSPLLETFLEFLLSYCFQCYRHIYSSL